MALQMPDVSDLKTELRRWLAPLSAATIVLSILLIAAFKEPPVYITTDQEQIGLMVLRRLMPENFANDYAVSDPALYGFYTPSFLIPATYLTRLTGSYDRALALMLIFIAVVYMIGMTALFYFLGRRRWLSVGLALLSMARYSAPTGGLWGPMHHIDGVTPRNIYLAFFPLVWGGLLLVLLGDQFPTRRRRLVWGGAGLTFGLLSNLHPVSAEVIGMVLGGLMILAVLRKDIDLVDCGLFFLFMIVGALPTLVTFLQGTEGVIPPAEYGFSFDYYYDIGCQRIATIWPWVWHARFAGGLDITRQPGSQLPVLVTHFVVTMIGFIGSLVSSSKQQPNRDRVWWSVILLAQLLMLFFTAQYFWQLALFGMYYLHRLYVDRELDGLDKRLLEMTAFISLLFLLTWFLQWIWRTFEVWSLSVWVTQPPRGYRFIQFPIYVATFRLLNLWLSRKDWLMLTLGGVLLLLPGMDILLVWVPVVAMGLSLYCPVPDRRPALIRAVMAGSLCTTIAAQGSIVVYGLNPPDIMICVGLVFVAITVVVGLLRAFPIHRNVVVVSSIALVLAGVISFFSVSNEGGSPGTQIIHSTVDYVKTQIWTVNPFPLKRQLGAREACQYELYEWAYQETPVDSLFFTDDYTFRLRARRSITHAWKDLGPAFFVRYSLITYHERWQWLSEASQQTDTLLRAVQETGADYVIMPVEQELGWEQVYQNQCYKVYAPPRAANGR
jgi:hypothetical protein